MDPAEIALFLGETLTGGYRPSSFLRAGNFCGTFEAEHPKTGEPVAIKILKLSRLSPHAIQEFQDEVKLLRQLNECSNVVDLVHSGQHAVELQHSQTGMVIPLVTEFAVLELAAGSLADLVLAGGAFGWPDRLRLYRDVVKGVHQMHLKRIVHRDVKAENALVFEGTGAAKVADLGRAHDTRQAPRFAIEAYLMGRGDPQFAPLEFLWGQGTDDAEDQARADLYLLGALLFEVVTGVALTQLVTSDPLAVMRANAALSDADRAHEWRHRIPELRDAARDAYETFAAQVAPAIRAPAVDLLALLTDPDPSRRVASVRGGRRRLDPWNLEWVLGRVDSMRRVIDPKFRRQYLTARPRSPKPSRRRIQKP